MTLLVVHWVSRIVSCKPTSTCCCATSLRAQWEALGSYITKIANVKLNSTEQEKREIRFPLEDAALLAIKSMDAEVAEKLLRYDGSTTIGVPQRKYHQLLKDLVPANTTSCAQLRFHLSSIIYLLFHSSV